VKLVVEHRKGKRTVTTVRGLADEGTHLSEVLTALKQACGAGGTIQDGILELQGEQVQRIAETLTARGYRVQRPKG
jgi:translation initiation factor 1